MEEVRIAVQRALDKLVNRFGTTGDVIGELETALALMKKSEAPASEKVVEVPAAEPPPPSKAEPKQVAKAEPKKAEPRPQTRKGMGRKGK